MKTCPTCNRNYKDETLNFCLDDGSVLTDSIDPFVTQRIPAPRDTKASPTEVLDQTRQPNTPAVELYPTIAAPQPPPLHSEKRQFESHEKRGNRTGLLISIAVVIGILLGVWITVSLMKAAKDPASNNRPEIKIANSNSGATNTNEKRPNALTDLPDYPWNECETYVSEFCGVWTRVSSGQWKGRWGGVESNLTITVNGKNVTVERRDTTQSTQATYRGTLNADNTSITGTVEWCCDTLGNRSGTWRAESAAGPPL